MLNARSGSMGFFLEGNRVECGRYGHLMVESNSPGSILDLRSVLFAGRTPEKMH